MAVGDVLTVLHTPLNFNKSLDKIFEDAQTTSEIKLSGRKLKEYPKVSLKHNLTDTVLADLSKNRFSELPVEICDYPSLERLHLHHNAIKTLPDQLGALQALSHLILSRNQLSILPSCVCRLTNLQVLDVSGNRLVSLPEELGFLTRLMELDASYNQLQLLPPSLGDLDDLRCLRLRRNHLQNIPTELCFLRLTCLDLSYNRIAALPSEMRFMSSLLDLSLEANPFVHPPANICTRGRVHIFKWLDQTALKEDRKRAISEVEFRKSRKYTKVHPVVADFRLVNGFLDCQHKRSTVDSGYGTSENGDPRWSHESQEFGCDILHPPDLIAKESVDKQGCQSSRTRNLPLPAYELPVNGSVSAASSEHTLSGHSTPSTLSPGNSFNLEDEFYKAMKLRQELGNGVYSNNTNSSCNTHHMFPHIGDNGFSLGRNGPDGAAASMVVVSTQKSPLSPVNGGSKIIDSLAPRFSPPTDPTHPQNPDPGGGTMPCPINPYPPVPTYREYLEAKRQQRAIDANNIYKRLGCDGVSPTFENPAPRNEPGSLSSSPSRPQPIGGVTTVKNITTGNRRNCEPGSVSLPRPTDLQEETQGELERAHVKSIQKEAVLSYVKSRVSPSKSVSTTPNASFDSIDHPPPPFHSVSHLPPPGNFNPQPSSSVYSSTNGGGHRNSIPISPLKGRAPLSPSGPMSIGVLKSRKRSGGGQPFDPDATSSRLNFTYRRELEKQQHEKQLVDSLRAIIEARLKMSLPSDLSAALMDGVVLCHLVNHVRPRAVSSIHVPSPAVPKLTIAKCRLNVENFLEACRKVGVEEEYMCSAPDVLEERGTVRVAITVERLLQFYQGRQTPSGRNHTSV